MAELSREELERRNDYLFKRVVFLEGIAQRNGRAIVFWQGKHAIVCRENNALRRKLRKAGE